MVKSKLPNVLVLATTFPRWKNDTEPAFVFDLSKGLVSKGYNITVLVPGAPGALSYEEMEQLKVYRFSYFFPKSLQKVCYDGGALPNLKSSWLARMELPFLLLCQFFHIGWLIKKERIDLIHCHWIIPQGLFSVLFKKVFKIPLILTAHAGDVFALKNTILKKIGRYILSNCEFFTANSKATRKVVLDLSKGGIPVKVIPMGVDLNVFNGLFNSQNIRRKYEIDGPMLLAVGRFAEKKGFKYLIEAMPLILKKYPKTKLLIIGFGPLERSLKNLVVELNIERSVVFPGKMPHSELAEYFASADIFVGPSIVAEDGDTEGLGVVFLEAIASKTAVVASNVGGIGDIVIHEKTGLMVEQKNPNDIFNKIDRLLSDTDLRSSIVEEGYSFIKKKYAWEVIQEKFSNLYHLAVNGA